MEAAVNQFSSQAINTFGADKLKAGLAQSTHDVIQKGGIASIETSETVIGDLATVQYTVTFNDGSTESGSQEMIKEDGDWKMQLTK